ncbi:IS3 family transposase [Luteococcus sediminum]
MVRACQVLGLARSTFYHRRNQPAPDPAVSRLRRSRIDSAQPAALSPAEHQKVLDVLTAEGTEHLSVCQAYWQAFDEQQVSCSQSTFYRIARRAGLVGDRRRGRHSTSRGRGSGRAKPVAAASRVHELWSWDISELPGPGRRKFQLFLVLDVFSRYPIGFRVECDASRSHAVDMFREAFDTHGVPHTLHSDNGSQMRSHDLANLLGGAITQSFSRPHVSNDNPFSEALFKTLKYDLAMPQHFDSIDHARTWVTDYLHGYAHHHRHAGLNRHTPHHVFTGTTDTIQARRQALLDRNYQAHPERYRRPPQAPPPPAPTGINLSKAA